MIRLLESKHANQLFKLEQSIFLHNAYSKTQIEDELKQKNRIYVGYFVKEKLVAYLGVMLIDIADVVKVGVYANFRKQGIATEMFNYVINMLKERNINAIMLEVNENNVSAIKLYENLGFKQIAVRQNYYGKDCAKIYKLEI